jgi:hypothetical protein
VIFSVRLVFGYTVPEFSLTRGHISPIRDLLALSLLLQRNNTTDGRISLALVEVACTNFNAFLHTLTCFKDEYQSDTICNMFFLRSIGTVVLSHRPCVH